jgi:DNA-binding response OmpR family regulator
VDTEVKELRALVVVTEPAKAEAIEQCLSGRGINSTVMSDPEDALSSCRQNPPNLAIVEDPLGSMSGTLFLNHLVRISWSTGTILIADSDESQVHDRAEGLGILGHMRSPNDLATLEHLLDRFEEVNSAGTAQE